ncbi:MAG: hypothetical protein HFH36_09710 [Lachnospiraceae bacterium]|nr:hypothetical protein [Lachnospiraceae bacterium]
MAQKHENVRRMVGDVMRGAMIETNARRILNQGISQGIGQGVSQGINETKKKTALRMLKARKLTVEEIAEYTELSVAEVEQLSEEQTV